MKTYLRKTYQVKAIQFLRKSKPWPREVQEGIPDCGSGGEYCVKIGPGNYCIKIPYEGYVSIKSTEWIVKESEDKMYILSDKKFRKMFKRFYE